MAYNKHTWHPQELITADKLNNIEDGINNNINSIDNMLSPIENLVSHAIMDTGDQTIAGNKTIVGNNIYMGSNTFMDGVSLNGKNKVNDIKDTDWLDIPLEEGRTGTAKYKVSMGKVFVHVDGVRGITGVGNTAQGRIGTLPVNPNPYYTRHTILVGNTIRLITILPNGILYVSNTVENNMSKDDPYLFDTVLM